MNIQNLNALRWRQTSTCITKCNFNVFKKILHIMWNLIIRPYFKLKKYFNRVPDDGKVQKTQCSALLYPTAFWARLKSHIFVPPAIFYSSTVGFAICLQPKQAWSRGCHFPLSIKHAGAETSAACLWSSSYFTTVMANAHYNCYEHETINLDAFANKNSFLSHLCCT